MNRGGRVETLFVMLIVAAIAVYGVWKYTQAENNSVAKFAKHAEDLERGYKDLAARVLAVEEKNSALELTNENLKTSNADLQARLVIIDGELEASQTHMEKLRKSQIDLRDRSYPRHVELTFKQPVGAIPIEIVKSAPPPKAQKADPQTVKRIKKQMDELSQ